MTFLLRTCRLYNLDHICIGSHRYTRHDLNRNSRLKQYLKWTMCINLDNGTHEPHSSLYILIRGMLNCQKCHIDGDNHRQDHHKTRPDNSTQVDQAHLGFLHKMYCLHITTHRDARRTSHESQCQRSYIPLLYLCSSPILHYAGICTVRCPWIRFCPYTGTTVRMFSMDMSKLWDTQTQLVALLRLSTSSNHHCMFHCYNCQ